MQLNTRARGGLLSDIIANPKNEAQVLAIVTRSGKEPEEPLKEKVSENMPKAIPKEVTPQRRKSNNDKKVDKIDEEVVEVEKSQRKGNPTFHVSPPFPQQLYKKEESDKLRKFMEKLSNNSISIPLLEAIQEIPGYAKLMKKLMSKKKLIEGDTIKITHGCSVIMDGKVVKKKDDPGAFTIPCTIGNHEFTRAICGLGARINLMSFVIFMKLILDTPTPTSMRLLMADQSIKRPVGILFDILIKVDKFILLVDFVKLNYEMDQEVPIIIGHPFLSTGRAIIDLELGEIKFWVQEDEDSFKIYKSKKQTVEL
ncbi:uncharacterized protein LOC107862884 [Capsicum annuum]|uniref:uncharacterized protein LOC107862884 n=1 Tax=Capsicum annuum TaxID=4072 RepID=UPI0007BF2571|nr:uncharacterized protein LOC107862884 [Capsicum annuum]